MANQSADTFRCIYCGRIKPADARSLEHIWPGALGGDWSPDWFKSSECCGKSGERNQCNHLMGQFVDAEFVRTPFGTSWRLSAELPFLNVAQPHALPLVFIGIQEQPPSAHEICESWLGPRGEAVYYIHSVDRDDFATYAGGDPIQRKKKDPGRVYFGLTRKNVYWLDVAFHSVRAKFPSAEIRMLTRIDAPDINSQFASESSQSVADRHYLQPIWAQKTQNVRQAWNLDNGARFHCKIALGFGHALFGGTFAERPYQETLLRGLWHRSNKHGEPPSVVGKNIWQPTDPKFSALFTNQGAYSLLFSRTPEGAWLSTFMPNGMYTSCMILPRQEMLPSEQFRQFTDQFMVLLYPALQRFVGPLPVVTYVEHRTGSRRVPELADIESKQKSNAEIEALTARFDISDADAA